MKQKDPKKKRGSGSKLGKIMINLLVTLVVGGVYFYVSLPALNFQSEDFYMFIGLLCVVYIVSALITSGFLAAETATAGASKTAPFKEYFKFIKKQCLPIGILIIALVVVAIVGQVISMPIFRAGDYRDLLDVQNGNFATDVQEVSFDEIPMLDEDSARRLGDRQMGTLSDMVSQFELSSSYTQINYQGRPVRVAPLEYADFIKWFTNRDQGLPAYVLVDMVTQEANVIRLQDGMRYSPSDPLNRNVTRHLRFQYPTFMFSTPSFEIDENGQPWWIAPRVVKTIGLFGGVDIRGAVMVNAVTGESEYHEQVPNWVDRVYPAYMIMDQYNYHGTLVNGFLNSVFGQRDVTVVTEDFNYLAMNDDVFMYTGVTSANSDQSNLGFLLSNQRTKETKFYPAPGATERSAQGSAMGAVQDLGYTATFPLLLNISGEPTYFMSLKDDNQLVKLYAMVNVKQYQIVATDASVAGCEQKYLALLGEKGVTTPIERPQTTAKGVVEEIRSAVLEGNTYYYLRLEGESVFYALSAAANPVAVVLNVGDRVTIEHAPAVEGKDMPILEGYSLVLDGMASPAPVATPQISEPVATPQTPEAVLPETTPPEITSTPVPQV